MTPPGASGVVDFDVPDAVRGWVNGSYANNGLVIKLATESSSNTLRFYGLANASVPNRPVLIITWSSVVGQQPWVQAYDHQLSDRLNVHVDYGDRNLAVNGTDEQMQGPGQSLVVRHTYNSGAAIAGIHGAYGYGWSMNGGVDTGINITREQVTFTQPGGAVAWFVRHFEQTSLTVKQTDNNPNGPSFISSPGIKADLTMPDSTHYLMLGVMFSVGG